jgi:hypothetical protein
LGSFGGRLVVGVMEGHSSLLLSGVAFAKECGDCKSLSLIHCEYTSDIWHLVLNLFRASWVMPGNILELLLLEDQRAWTFQRGNLESYSCFFNIEHLERKESTPP